MSVSGADIIIASQVATFEYFSSNALYVHYHQVIVPRVSSLFDLRFVFDLIINTTTR